jgi:hypothetical protein
MDGSLRKMVCKIDIVKEVFEQKLGASMTYQILHMIIYLNKLTHSHSIETIYRWMVTSVVGQTFVLI